MDPPEPDRLLNGISNNVKYGQLLIGLLLS